MGTRYVRLNQVPVSVNIQKGQQVAALTIDHIQADEGLDITNVLAIHLRQKVSTELSWVTITNTKAAAEVKFDRNAPVGNHKLTFESIDLNSPLMPTPTVLKTDVINVSVYADPYFEQVGQSSKPLVCDLASEENLF